MQKVQNIKKQRVSHLTSYRITKFTQHHLFYIYSRKRKLFKYLLHDKHKFTRNRCDLLNILLKLFSYVVTSKNNIHFYFYKMKNKN